MVTCHATPSATLLLVALASPRSLIRDRRIDERIPAQVTYFEGDSHTRSAVTGK